MEERILGEILSELKKLNTEISVMNEDLREVKKEIKIIKENTNFISDTGMTLVQKTAIASERLADKITA